MKKLKIGISIGDVNGIGLEVIIKTFADNRMLDVCTPIVYGSSSVSSFHRKTLGINDFSFNIIDDAEKANPKKANIINCWEEEIEINLGQDNEIGGKYALLSLNAVSNDLLSGKIDAIVTAPINKNNIQAEEFQFNGHTEFFSEKFEGNALMFMVSDNLKIGLATNHIAINAVAKALNATDIFNKIKILNKSLIQDFRITSPKIAVLGLNPHAGDNGLIGKEEKETILPTINNAKSIGINAFGPYPADGFFGSGNYKKFDAVLAMYHDQGLIPFKTLSFGEGVNFTAGLNMIRTSPDHGVAYDIAGKNIASENSFRNAIYMACDIYRHRKEEEILLENALVAKK